VIQNKGNDSSLIRKKTDIESAKLYIPNVTGQYDLHSTWRVQLIFAAFAQSLQKISRRVMKRRVAMIKKNRRGGNQIKDRCRISIGGFGRAVGSKLNRSWAEQTTDPQRWNLQLTWKGFACLFFSFSLSLSLSPPLSFLPFSLPCRPRRRSFRVVTPRGVFPRRTNVFWISASAVVDCDTYALALEERSRSHPGLSLG